MLEIKPIHRADYKKAQAFAIEGMHFYWYMSSPFLLRLYANYFWCMELNRATHLYAAYADGAFLGVLLAEIKGEPKHYRNIWRALYVRIFDAMQYLVAGKGVGAYDTANTEMLRAFQKQQAPDGEILFLAASPQSQGKGVGTALLRALERDAPGKLVYLYTDDACSYQFYAKRGFTLSQERDIALDLGKKQVPLRCFLYSKHL